MTEVPDFWRQFLPDITWERAIPWDEVVITLRGDVRYFLRTMARQFDASNHKPGDPWRDGQFASPEMSTYYGLAAELVVAMLLGQEPNLTIGADDRGDLFLPLREFGVVEVKATWTNSLLIRCARIDRNIVHRLPMHGNVFVLVKLLHDDSGLGPDDCTQVQIMGIALREEIIALPDSKPRTDRPDANWLNKELYKRHLHSFGDWLKANVDLINPWWKNSDIIHPTNFSDEIIHSLPRRESQVPLAHP